VGFQLCLSVVVLGNGVYTLHSDSSIRMMSVWLKQKLCMQTKTMCLANGLIWDQICFKVLKFNSIFSCLYSQNKFWRTWSTSMKISHILWNQQQASEHGSLSLLSSSYWKQMGSSPFNLDLQILVLSLLPTLEWKVSRILFVCKKMPPTKFNQDTAIMSSQLNLLQV